MDKNVILTAKDLSKTFSNASQQQHVLKNLNLDIYRRDFTVIMGNSGSGKSTLLYALSGMDRPSLGTITYKGTGAETEISKFTNDQLAKFRRNHCGFVFQQNYLNDSMSALDNVMVSGLLLTKDRKALAARAQSLLEKVEIGKDDWNKFSAQMSGGMQQRVAVVRGVINKPEILFADEPTGALNSQNTNNVLEILSGLNNEGQSIVMVTHTVRAAERQRLINKGQMETNGAGFTSVDLEKAVTDRYKELIAPFGAANPEVNYLNYLSVCWDNMKGGASFLPMIICAIIMLFAVIIMVIAMIIITFSIRNFIHRSMKDTGALEAGGYTVRELRGALTVQIASAALAGSLTGVLLGVATFGVFGRMVSGVLGLSWNQPVNILTALVTVAALTGLMILVVIFVEALIIRAKIIREWRGMGISKALGMTSGGLIVQIMLSNIPAIATGIIAGILLAPMSGSRLTIAILSLFGIEKIPFHIPAGYMVFTGAAILAVALATAGLLGLRVRRINPVEMITEE